MGSVNACVHDIVSHAYEKVPFYRNAFNKAGINPSKIYGVRDLSLLPIISRVDLMAGGPSYFLRQGANPDKLIVKHTTGTSGNPTIVYMNLMEQTFRHLTFLDSLRRNVHLKLPLTLVDFGPERKDSATQIFRQIGPFKIVRIFRNLPMEQQIKILTSIKPTILGGRPSMFWELALVLKEQGIRPSRPALIRTGAEMLFDHVRFLLQDVFNCKVVDYYNCEEAGNLAWECPENQNLMHPNTANVWIEIVDQQDKPVSTGGEGRIVITNLYNYTMPFIRYPLGDRGVFLDIGKCSCGYNGPIMRLTEGRDENFIVLPDGKEITPRHIFDIVNTSFPYDKPGWNLIDCIRIFQIIQEADDLILIKVIPGPAYTESFWPNVQNNLRKLHPAIRLQIELVDDLSPAPGKKFHQVLGKLSSRWKTEREKYGIDTD
jgi:phenylacetate-CoA ligase